MAGAIVDLLPMLCSGSLLWLTGSASELGSTAMAGAIHDISSMHIAGVIAMAQAFSLKELQMLES